MINFNGDVVSKDKFSLSVNNRGFKYGDALFETIKVLNNKVIFAEDHYFRLMASMRMLRMKIPIEFTLEYFEGEIDKTVKTNELVDARIRLSVFRKDGGLYLPEDNEINFLIEANQLLIPSRTDYEVDLFKDHYIYSGMLSTIKTNNKILNIIANIYATENELDNCILLNEKKQLVEALNANIFLVKGSQILTPSLSEGCLKGVIRKNIISMIKKDNDYEITETAISPFELQKVDEVFITNSIIGIQSVTKYRKTTYSSEIATQLHTKLNILEKLS